MNFEDLAEMLECPTCHSEQSREEALLGGLGALIHFRCRCCGMGWSESEQEGER